MARRVGKAATCPAAARRVRADWDRLCTGAGAADRFDPALVAGLPEPARRWLRHAIAPGTSLARGMLLRMTGQIRLGSWQPFRAVQVLAPPDGFIWAATARVAGLPVSGFDRYSSGTGEMRWRFLRLVPVMSAGGLDVTRSAAGRLAGETVLAPTTFRGATWSAEKDPDTVSATWRLGGEPESVSVRIGPGGEVVEVTVQRWGNPDGAPYGRYPFGVAVEEERTFAGLTIPAAFRAGWWWGTDRQPAGEFFRARLTDAVPIDHGALAARPEGGAD